MFPHKSFPQVPTQTSNLEVDPPGGVEKKKGITSRKWRLMNLDTTIIWRQVLNGTENIFDDGNHKYQLEIIAAYRMLNEKKTNERKSR